MKDMVTLIMESECNVLKIAATYDEWWKMGCQILKGQKPLRRRWVDNKPIFEIWQTEPIFLYDELKALDEWERDHAVYHTADSMEILDEEQWH